VALGKYRFFDWTGTYYQHANRLAVIRFLTWKRRTPLGKPKPLFQAVVLVVDAVKCSPREVPVRSRRGLHTRQRQGPAHPAACRVEPTRKVSGASASIKVWARPWGYRVRQAKAGAASSAGGGGGAPGRLSASSARVPAGGRLCMCGRGAPTPRSSSTPAGGAAAAGAPGGLPDWCEPTIAPTHIRFSGGGVYVGAGTKVRA
jgi:hypothetical protein